MTDDRCQHCGRIWAAHCAECNACWGDHATSCPRGAVRYDAKTYEPR